MVDIFVAASPSSNQTEAFATRASAVVDGVLDRYSLRFSPATGVTLGEVISDIGHDLATVSESITVLIRAIEDETVCIDRKTATSLDAAHQVEACLEVFSSLSEDQLHEIDEERGRSIANLPGHDAHHAMKHIGQAVIGLAGSAARHLGNAAVDKVKKLADEHLKRTEKHSDHEEKSDESLESLVKETRRYFADEASSLIKK
jgi:hypothetical protein